MCERTCCVREFWVTVDEISHHYWNLCLTGGCCFLSVSPVYLLVLWRSLAPGELDSVRERGRCRRVAGRASCHLNYPITTYNSSCVNTLPLSPTKGLKYVPGCFFLFFFIQVKCLWKHKGARLPMYDVFKWLPVCKHAKTPYDCRAHLVLLCTMICDAAQCLSLPAAKC